MAARTHDNRAGEKVLAFLTSRQGRHAKSASIARKLGKSQASVSWQLMKLEKEGKVKRAGTGKRDSRWFVPFVPTLIRKLEEQRPLGVAPNISVPVTQKRIDEGAVRNSNHCMVAESLHDALPHLSRVAVDVQTIRATDVKRKERYVWLTPASVQRLIIDFDRGIKPRPFMFRCTGGQTVKMAHRGSRKSTIDVSTSGSRKYRVRAKGGRTPAYSIGIRRTFGLKALQY